MTLHRHSQLLRPQQTGIGLIEVLVALLILATGMTGLMITQLAGKKAAHEAAQRSIATVLVRDIIERVQANPGSVQDYVVTNAGDETEPLPAPANHCERVDCSPTQLAAFDLWQWESLLLGTSEKQGERNVGGLVSPRACIAYESGAVSVAISWLGVTAAREPDASTCGGDVVGLYDAPDEPAGNNARRRHMVLSTYIGEL
jgi:type IV pilus assembly protein PilV